MRARLLQFVTGTSKVPMNGFAELQGQISDNNGMIVGVYRCFTPVASFHDFPILYVAHNKTISLCVVLSSSQVLACAFDSAPIVTSTSPSHRKQWTSKVLHQETRRPFIPPKGTHMVSVRCCWVSQGGGYKPQTLVWLSHRQVFRGFWCVCSSLPLQPPKCR